LNAARARARDAKRISDVQQLQTALEMYYNDINDYPVAASMSPGMSISANGNIYLKKIPTPPTPVDGCTSMTQTSYAYVYYNAANSSDTYSITYCLGATVNGITGNTPQTASPSGIQ
jgi:hypothetical protein